jgi:hypothetical protein
MNEATMTMALRRKQAAEDQVRVAYGAVPVILEGLPADDPFRTAIRDRARSLLLELGYLTAEELGALPVKDAIAAVRRRLRNEIGRTGKVREVYPYPTARVMGCGVLLDGEA